MKNLIVFISVLLFAARCFAQTDANIPFKPDGTMFPFAKKGFHLKDSAIQNDALKQILIKRAMPIFKDEANKATVYKKGSEVFDEKKFNKAFELLDINNDGLYDLIYTGPSGAEENEVAIALNTGKGFKMILKELGYLKNLEFKDSKLFSIAMDETGCCLDYINFNKVYKISYRRQDADVTLAFLSSAIQNTWFPDEYFATPIRFEVLNSVYKMRAEPMIDDTSKNRVESLGERRKGNVVDTLNKGTRGLAIASHTDNTGRVWWLVEVDQDYNAYGHLFYEEDNDNTRKATKMGWISSRFVEKLLE